MKSYDNIVTFYSGSGLDTLAVNSSTPATPDGTEYIAELINQGMFGWQQDLMDYASLTPTGVIDIKGTNQLREAIQLGNGVGPGKLVGWFLDDDPSVTGDRVLLMQGQGVLISVYPDLDAVVYVGDGNNATVHAGGGKFYRSSDAGGTTPNIAGPYLQLPEGRGYALRGLDIAAAVDPDGASRFLGDNQSHAIQGHAHTFNKTPINSAASGTLNVYASATNSDTQVTGVIDHAFGTVTVKTETRMSNLSIQFGITY